MLVWGKFPSKILHESGIGKAGRDVCAHDAFFGRFEIYLLLVQKCVAAPVSVIYGISIPDLFAHSSVQPYYVKAKFASLITL
jgi:hypothetical protein